MFWRVDWERFEEAAGAVVVCRPALEGAEPRGSGAAEGAGATGVSLARVSAGSAMGSTAVLSSVVLSAASSKE